MFIGWIRATDKKNYTTEKKTQQVWPVEHFFPYTPRGIFFFTIYSSLLFYEIKLSAKGTHTLR